MYPLSKGKVWDKYDIGGEEFVLVASNRISAFDSVLPDEIPYKGAVLTSITEFWLKLIQRDLHIPTHLSSGNIPPFFCNPNFYGRTMLVKKLVMLPVECIVRGYITEGNGWNSYLSSGAICGVKLPSGLQLSSKLPQAIFTPTKKASEGHDENISYSQLETIVGKEIAAKLMKMSLAIYAKCSEYALERGIVIADTKFEFGVDLDGTIVLADEVLTPDSSRFWSKSRYSVGALQNSLDKQGVRDYLTSIGWDKNPPAPHLPEEVIRKTSAKYRMINFIITGNNLPY